MTLITVMEIASNYPNGDILIDAVQFEDNKKWTSLMYLTRNGQIHKLMLSFDRQEEFEGWDTKEEAISKMEEIRNLAIEKAIDYIAF